MRTTARITANVTSCPSCKAKVILCGDEMGAVFLVDAQHVPDAHYVLRKAINSAPTALRATPYSIGLRFQQHRCARPTTGT